MSLPPVNGRRTTETPARTLFSLMYTRARGLAEQQVPEGFRALFKGHKDKEVRGIIAAVAEALATLTIKGATLEARVAKLEHDAKERESRIIMPRGS